MTNNWGTKYPNWVKWSYERLSIGTCLCQMAYQIVSNGQSLYKWLYERSSNGHMKDCPMDTFVSNGISNDVKWTVFVQMVIWKFVIWTTLPNGLDTSLTQVTYEMTSQPLYHPYNAAPMLTIRTVSWPHTRTFEQNCVCRIVSVRSVEYCWR